MQRLASLLLVAGPFVSDARAQSFNLDLGTNPIQWPVPTNGYGAAANQPGFWDAVVPPYAQNLTDLAGITSTAQLTATGGPGALEDPSTGLTGNDEAFMADQLFVPSSGAVVGLEFVGLENGFYDVYTYAWASSGSATIIDVPSGSGGPQTVGGAWSGSPHGLGVTYSLHSVLITTGTLVIEARGGTFAGSGSLNGIQLVKTSGGSSSNYCGTSQNSTGMAAVISNLGSTSIGLNGFVLAAGPVPNQPGLFYYGSGQAQLPFGNGWRCVTGTTARLPVIMPISGTLSYPVDFTNPPSGSTQITPGSTWNFQAWFRDPAGGGAGFNLSDGLEVTFLP